METLPPDTTATDEADDEVVVLPWWQSPWNITALVLAAAILAASIGFVVGNNRATPEGSDVDVGFLQDMRWHHEQAVTMSLMYLDKPDASNAIKALARDIVVTQNIEIGRMIQMLRDFGAEEASPTDIGMAWMGEPMELDRMPGMATEADLDQLRTSQGAEADEIFVALMIAHHEGGLHMAEFAVENASDERVQSFAQAIVNSQTGEIRELEIYLEGSRP